MSRRPQHTPENLVDGLFVRFVSWFLESGTGTAVRRPAGVALPVKTGRTAIVVA